MPVIYKILFEVKLMHEFYFTTKDGNTIFEKATQAERLVFLKGKYQKGSPSVANDLEFDFPESLKAAYSSYCLKILPSFSGFKVAIKVNKKILADETIAYQPFVPLPGNLAITVLITKKNGDVDSYSNSRINTSLPALYYFSNDKVISGNTFPFLTNAISEFNSNYTYEHGELVAFGNNDIRGYFQNSAGDQWQVFTGAGFANENDRILLPTKFNYSFPAESNVKDVEFILKSPGGGAVKSIRANGTDRMEKIQLDFSDKKDLLSLPASSRPTDRLFTLEVNGDNYMRTHFIFFSDVLYNRAVWGVTSFVLNPANPDFKLFASDGYLVTRKRLSGDEDPPLFEIPIKSRFAFWRYAHQRGDQILISLDLAGFLVEEEVDPGVTVKRLISVRPRALSSVYFKVQNESGTDSKYLPNPVSYSISRDKAGRPCFDIMVPESDLFQVI
ncbi:MAG: hypothetical protein H7Y42_04085 [Chitinophagaceae bacterium]|nr:hypothetical protein [Chitinophagaceae bacterium]